MRLHFDIFDTQEQEQNIEQPLQMQIAHEGATALLIARIKTKRAIKGLEYKDYIQRRGNETFRMRSVTFEQKICIRSLLRLLLPYRMCLIISLTVGRTENSPFRCKLPPHDPLIARIKTKGLSRRQQLDIDLMAQGGVVSGPFFTHHAIATSLAYFCGMQLRN